MQSKLENARVLMYSHDTFGLGHLRRCRTIAHALVEQYKGLSVLILTGSPIIGRFDFKARVDFVRIPGVIKLHNGEYTSLGLHINLEHTLALRQAIILNTAQVFDPDLFIVDKEPLGLKGEVESTLQMLLQRGTASVLGLRDVLDAPGLLKREWNTKGAMPALERYYDEIWIYGDESMGNPLQGLDIPDTVTEKIHYTGYLPRSLPEKSHSQYLAEMEEPYLLVTPGGGGDGVEMVDWVLRAYERCSDLPWRALFILGPFMAVADQERFRERAAVLERVSLITFDNHIESLMDHAAGVVAMGGYNTFCEILSFNKRALVIPRTTPREEQLIRARNALKLGLIQVLEPEHLEDTDKMVQAIKALQHRPLPANLVPPHFMDGLRTLNKRFYEIIEATTKNPPP